MDLGPVEPFYQLFERIFCREVVNPGSPEVLLLISHFFTIDSPAYPVSCLENHITFMSIIPQIASSCYACSSCPNDDNIKNNLKIQEVINLRCDFENPVKFIEFIILYIIQRRSTEAVLLMRRTTIFDEYIPTSITTNNRSPVKRCSIKYSFCFHTFRFSLNESDHCLRVVSLRSIEDIAWVAVREWIILYGKLSIYQSLNNMRMAKPYCPVESCPPVVAPDRRIGSNPQ
jgi:hypothetical protein